ncbi:MAG: ATP-dependent helicase [Phycisphaerales bacterium]|nr:ATP-dependent helicase [Phycisphaerales bacterium]
MTDHEPPAPAIKLNEQQQRAVDHAAGPLMVLAGPGTGKTRVIIERIANLIEQRNADPATILAVTFTVKATEQMRTKLAERLAHNARAADLVRIRTFHGLGREMLQRFADYLGLPATLTLMDSAQRRRLLRAIIAENNLYTHAAAEGVDTAAERAALLMKRCRECARSTGDALAYAARWRDRHEQFQTGLHGDMILADAAHMRHFEAGAKAFDHFERRCMQLGWIAFDDYIAHPIRLLREHPEVAAMVRSETRHIVVDEFQDVNPAQIELLRLLAPPDRNPDLCVVGDDDQAIYAFRGADPRAMAQFARIWGDHATEKLEINYRSGRRIIDLANEVISKAERVDSEKFARVPDGEPNGTGTVQVISTDGQNPRDAVIPAMILIDKQSSDRKFSDYAVLTRLTIDADRVAAALRMHGIPVNLREKRTPLDDAGVQDVLSWMRILTDASNTADVQRLLSRPPVAIRLTRVSRLAADFTVARREHADERPFIEWLRDSAHDPSIASWLALYDELLSVAAALPADRAIDEIIRRSGVVEAEALEPLEKARRVQNLVPLIRFARRVQPFLDPPRDLNAFLSYYNDLDAGEKDFSFANTIDANDDDADAEAHTPDAVSILTAHRAKGLEFDTVFVVRCNPGHGFPQSRPADDDPLPLDFSGIDPLGRADEERRLFYVACTRAERRLVLTTKSTKSVSEKNFIHQLRDTLPFKLDETHETEWLKDAPLGITDPMDQELADEGDPETDARNAILRAEFARARQAALSALHEAERAADGVAPPHTFSTLTDAAARIAALSYLRVKGTLPEDQSALSPDAREHLRAVADRLARAIGPAWPILKSPLKLSYSKINDYLACPRCFLVKHVLGLDEAKTAELSVGHIVHIALERFFKEWRLADAEGRPLPTRDRLIHLCTDALRAESRTNPLPTDHEHRALLEQIQTLALNALDKLHDDANILHIEKWVEFPYDSSGRRHHFIAKLDRVDQLASGHFRIVDYKTGQSSKKLLEPRKDDLQMAIYAMALPRLLNDDDRPIDNGGVAEYWLLRTAERGTIGFDAIDFDKVRAQIDKVITGVLAGQYGRNESTCKGLCEIIGQ